MHFWAKNWRSSTNIVLCLTGPTNEPGDSWKVAAITSFSVLAAVVVFGALLIGILVHQCRSRRTLRGKSDTLRSTMMLCIVYFFFLNCHFERLCQVIQIVSIAQSQSRKLQDHFIPCRFTIKKVFILFFTYGFVPNKSKPGFPILPAKLLCGWRFHTQQEGPISTNQLIHGMKKHHIH